MSKAEKLKTAFAECSATFPWRDFVRLLDHLGYELDTGGNRGASRTYVHRAMPHRVITLHEPHDGVMTRSMIKRVRSDLKDHHEL